MFLFSLGSDWVQVPTTANLAFGFQDDG
eukprot:SAG31_NODE_40213_length_282_cov_0.852459_1_plen_27_part_01